MSLFTSSSKLWRGLVIALTVFVIGYLAAWAAYGPALRSATTHDAYHSQPASKIRHMEITVAADPVDYVFVGDSTTQYHVATSLLAVPTYNLGIPGTNVSQFASMALAATNVSPDAVVLLIHPDVLYQRHWGWSGSEEIDDLIAVWQAENTLRGRLSTIKQAAFASNRLATASPIIIDLIARAYAAVEPGDATPVTSVETLPGCQSPSATTTEVGLVVRCQNGEGYILGGAVDETARTQAVSLNTIDPGKVRFLNALHDDLAQRGTRLIVMLQPRYRTAYQHNPEQVVQALSADVLDLSHADIANDPQFWSDAVHLNAEGRTQFTKLLAEALHIPPAIP
jgi:hypothetical protein